MSRLSTTNKHQGGAQQSRDERFNGLKWLLCIGLLGAGVVGNGYYAEVSLLYRVLALLALALVASLIAVQTTQGRAFWELMKEARIEIRKVVWPTYQETTQTTLVVLVLVFVIALILWGLDSFLGWLVADVIG